MSCNGSGVPRRRAVIERHDLPQVGYGLYELIELDEAGEKLGVLSLAPANLIGGQPDPNDVERAKKFLHLFAERAQLEIIWEDA